MYKGRCCATIQLVKIQLSRWGGVPSQQSALVRPSGQNDVHYCCMIVEQAIVDVRCLTSYSPWHREGLLLGCVATINPLNTLVPI